MFPDKFSKFKYEHKKWTDEIKNLLHLSDLILNKKHASYDTCKNDYSFDSIRLQPFLVKVILPVSILMIFCLYK